MVHAASSTTSFRMPLVLAAAAGMLLLGVAVGTAWLESSPLVARSGTGAPALLPVGEQAGSSAFDGRRAYGYLKQICELGPRPSGSVALEQHRKLVEEHFRKLGAVVRRQQFQARDPLSRKTVDMANIIVSWQPEITRRIVLGAHYDTRPFPDLDPTDRRGRFIGANDGASGVALLMELAYAMRDLNSAYGVDFVLFDGEELVYDERGEFFLGSKHFARQYRRRNRNRYTYVAGVVVDMIGDRDLQIYPEVNSMRLAPALVEQIWHVAGELGVNEFSNRRGHEIRDDHLPLNSTGNIPACVLIDFDYPAWHTTADTPEQCSAESLGKVGRVLLEWLRRTS